MTNGQGDYRSAFGAVPWPVFVTCGAGRIQWTNEAASNHWDDVDDSLTNCNVSQLISHNQHNEDESNVLEQAVRIQQANACLSLGVWKTLHPTSAAGKLVEVYVNRTTDEPSSELQDDAFIFYMVDVSREMKSREEIRRRDKHLHQILDNTAAVVYVKTTDGRYRFVNKHFEELFHLRRTQVLGKSDFDIFPKEMAERFRENDDHVVRSKEVLRVEEVAPHDDGPHNYISVKFPLTDHRGDINGVAGISTDITDLIRVRQELETAQAVQNLLYPKNAPDVPGFDISGAVSSAELACGDYFDYISHPGGLWDLVVGDVSGHGLGPALEMVETRAYLHALLASEMLESAFFLLNHFLIRDLHDSGFVTLFLARLDPYSNTLHYVGAGHNAMLFRANGDVQTLRSTSPLLGIDPKAKYRASERITMQPGDILLAATDGIAESVNGDRELFGTARIMDYVQSMKHEASKDIANGLIELALKFGEHRPQADDMTVLVAKALPK